MQCIAAYVVRYARWRYVFASGVAEILLAIFFFQPYPTHYVGTVPYAWACSWPSPASSCWCLHAASARWGPIRAGRQRTPDFMPTASAGPAQTVFDGPPLESGVP